MNINNYTYTEHIVDVQEGNTKFGVFFFFTDEDRFVKIIINDDCSVYFLYRVEDLHYMESLNKLISDNVDIYDVENRYDIAYFSVLYGADY